MRDSRVPVVVVGAGPAGLATSAELRRLGVDHLVLERGPSVGTSWRSFYTSLVLHTGKHLSSLPRRPFGRRDPLFVPRGRFVEYLDACAASDALPIETGVTAVSAIPSARGWTLETTAGTVEAGTLVVATGIASSPQPIAVRGDDGFPGTIRHSIVYRDPAPFLGRRVLVVGSGNSGAEIAAELGRAGVDTTIAVRSGVIVVPLTILGIPSQYVGLALRQLPRAVARPIARVAVDAGVRRRRDGLPRSHADPLDIIPIVGTHLSDGIRSRRVRLRPGLDRLEGSVARFVDGGADEVDDVILATGFRAAIDWLPGTVTRDPRGFAARRDRVASVDLPRLLFVGHTYDAGGGLVNIRRDAPRAARIARELVAGR